LGECCASFGISIQNEAADQTTYLMMLDRLFYLALLATLVVAPGCGAPPAEPIDDISAEAVATDVETSALNTLTAEEEAAGWKLLFDGRTTAGWHNYGKTDIGPAWKVTDGVLSLDVSNKGDHGVVGGGDIVTDEAYDNYELALEWKIDSCGNSGIIFNVVESEEYDYPWQTGPEMQVLDNECHPDAKYPDHRAGDLYDLIAVSEQTVRPAGEWNQVRLINRKGLVEHWLNGTQVVTVDMTGEDWLKMVGESKFKDMPAFGRATAGRIALQDHGDGVHFRNIKIRSLNEE
jgi:cytochrome c